MNISGNRYILYVYVNHWVYWKNYKTHEEALQAWNENINNTVLSNGLLPTKCKIQSPGSLWTHYENIHLK